MDSVFKILDKSFIEPQNNNHDYCYPCDLGKIELANKCYAQRYDKYGAKTKEDDLMLFCRRLAGSTTALSNSAQNKADFFSCLLADLYLGSFYFDETILSRLGTDLNEETSKILYSLGYGSDEGIFDILLQNLSMGYSLGIDTRISLTPENFKQLSWINKVESKYKGTKNFKIFINNSSAEEINMPGVISALSCIVEQNRGNVITIEIADNDINLESALSTYSPNVKIAIRITNKNTIDISEKIANYLEKYSDTDSAKIDIVTYNDNDDLRKFIRIPDSDQYYDEPAGYINLPFFVKKDVSADKKYIDVISLIQQIYRSVEYLDALVNYNMDYDDYFDSRNINLSVMGLAEVFMDMGKTYGDPVTLDIASALARIINGALAIICANNTSAKEDALIKSLFLHTSLDPDYITDDQKAIDLVFDIFNGNIKLEDNTVKSDLFIKYFNRLRDIVALFLAVMDFDNVSDLKTYIESNEQVKQVLVNIVKNTINGKLSHQCTFSLESSETVSRILGVTDSIGPVKWLKLYDKKTNKIYTHYKYDEAILNSQSPDELDKNKVKNSIFAGYLDVDTITQLKVYNIFAEIVDGRMTKTIPLIKKVTKEEIDTIIQYCLSSSIKELTFDYNRQIADYIEEITNKPDENAANDSICAVESPENIVRKDEKPEENTYVSVLLNGYTEMVMTPLGMLYVTLNYNGTDIVDCCIKIDNPDLRIQSLIEAISQLIRLNINPGIKLNTCIDILSGITEKERWNYDPRDSEILHVHSIPDLISKVLIHIKSKIEKIGGNDAI